MSEAPALYDPSALVRFGTSSFSSKDWVGPFYPRGMAPGAFLTEYARHFDTVEVDATYYALPSARLVDGWREKVPDGFLLSAKFPKSIVHAGKTYKPDPTRILDPDATYEDRDVFLEQMRRMGDKLAYLLIQFPYFNRATFPSAGPFLERLDTFLRDLPKDDLRFAVEIRNKAWLKEDFVELLRRHGVSLVLVDQAWMPHGDEVTPRFDVLTGTDCYIRLLGDRKEIEKITKSWGEEVIDHTDRMLRWATLIRGMMKQGVRSFVYVNNHYAGHAPTTVRRLREMVEME
ncbi:MAG: DUF72 domain-containing protein [Planctomycetota bacterium]|nr:DUF72 domain-containing protein [Planctomycetota bacterium]